MLVHKLIYIIADASNSGMWFRYFAEIHTLASNNGTHTAISSAVSVLAQTMLVCCLGA
jgi:hypothetical protein